MKNLVILFMLLLITPLWAQEIVQVEYFIDSDPGYGLGTPVSISPAEEIDINFTADLNEVNEGFHVLYVRIKDANGKWSLATGQPFLKEFLMTTDVAPFITDAEYFIDNDPGYGNGTDIPITQGDNIDESFIVDLSNISVGFHVLYVRLKDENGKWSLATARPFMKEFLMTNDEAPMITEAEYFIDEDPEYGNGTAITITQADNIDESFIVDLSDLSDGFHMLYIRIKDENGKWSLANSRAFSKEFLPVEHTPNITQVEYFIDEDPGYGNGINVPITAQDSLDHSFIVDLSNLSDGFHVLYVRMQDENGKWSLANRKSFLHEDDQIYPISAIEYYVTGEGIDEPVVHTDHNFLPAEDIDVRFVTDLAGLLLAEDYHLYVTLYDENYVPSLTYNHTFDIVEQVAILWNLAEDEVTYRIYAGETQTETGLIAFANFGDSNLTWQITDNVDWLHPSPASGELLPTEEQEIELYFDASNLEEGTYTALVTIESNDPYVPVYEIPVELMVETFVGIDDQVEIPTVTVPERYHLSQNFPNPFNPTTTINYELPVTTPVLLKIYDVSGQLIKTLIDAEKEAGHYSVIWDGTDSRNRAVSSGVYFYRIEAGDMYHSIKRMVLLK